MRNKQNTRVLGVAMAVAWASVTVLGADVSSKSEHDASPELEEIVLVFKTHFDIGYTDMAAKVVERYRTSMIEQALDVVDDSRALPEERRFVWTIPGWPMSKILEDWEGQTPKRKQRLMAAFGEGRFVVHGLPFTTHTETLSEEDLVRGLSYSGDLSRGAGFELPRDAKMTDVPCHSWIVPTLLAHAGIEFLHIGTNSGSSDPKVPLLHFREGPDGSRVLTMHVNGYGTGYMPPDNWPYRTWLGLIHTGDNHGPPRPEEVRRILNEIDQRMPGVKVRIGRLSDFADAILAKEDLDTIPIVRGDTPDTWIHGPMCDPQGRIAARRAHANLPTAESLTTMLETWGISSARPAPWQSLANGYEQSLLYGEHTWGASLGWVGHALPWGPDWQKQTDERHRRMVASWDEHSAYANKADTIAASLLDDQLRCLSQSIDSDRDRGAVYNPLPWKRDGIAVVDGTTRFVREVPPMGYRTLYRSDLMRKTSVAILRDEDATLTLEREPFGDQVVQNDFFRLTYNLEAGRLVSLVDKRADRELVRPNSKGFGTFLYERFSADQCDRFMYDYALKLPKWVTTQFTKPNLPRDVPYQAKRPGSPTGVSEIRASDYIGVRFSYRDDPALPCKRLEYEIRMYSEVPVVDLSLEFEGKRPDTWPEAGWMCLPLKIEGPNFRLSRLGGIVDPRKDVIPGSNRHLFWLHHGLAVYGNDGYGVGICPLDAPMVSLGEPGCWRFSWDYLPENADVFVNLFNNQWNTNFRLWNEGTWRQTVRLWTFKQYEPATSLIQPALEARFPMVGRSTADFERRGNLPPEATGLQLSRRDVLVTSFGVDPGTQKLMLRLWEQAGKDDPCVITLPKGLAVRAVQPCDLRGRPVGDPLAVESGRLQLDVRHNAPWNLELIRRSTPSH